MALYILVEIADSTQNTVSGLAIRSTTPWSMSDRKRTPDTYLLRRALWSRGMCEFADDLQP